MAQIAVFLVITLVAAVVVSFGGIGMLAYALPKSMAKFGAAPAKIPIYNQMPPAGDSWSFVYSGGMSGDASAFTFPKTDCVHYVIKKAQGLAFGKTITMKFNLSGDGELKVADPADIAPATLRLFIWGQTINDRWWGNPLINLENGDLTLSIPIDPSRWTGVGGNPPVVQAPFADVIANPYAMGWTLGGQYFAGHGVYCPAGVRTFKLIEYSVS